MSASQKSGLDVKCDCGLDAVRRISNTPYNPNRPFYKCYNANSGGCKMFKWEDQLLTPTVQTGLLTPASSQPQSQPPSPIKASIPPPPGPSTPIKSPWTNQAVSRTPSATDLGKGKRKRSLSPSRGPTTPLSGKVLPPGSVMRSVLAGLSGEAPGNANTSPTGEERGRTESPMKRARLDNTAVMIVEDDEEELTIVASGGIAHAYMEDDLAVSLRQGPKRLSGVSNRDKIKEPSGREREVARKLEFSRLRVAGTDSFPVLEDDPANPFLATSPTTRGERNNTAATSGGPSSLIGLLSVALELRDGSPCVSISLPDLERLITRLKDTAEADSKRDVKALKERVKALENEVQTLNEELTKRRW